MDEVEKHENSKKLHDIEQAKNNRKKEALKSEQTK